MTPSIKKGDAVILKKVSARDKLKKGDVIAYQKDDNIIIHRIHEVNSSNGKVSYITKGDANNSVDVDAVSEKQIRGVLKVKVPYIAYPTIWFSENFKR